MALIDNLISYYKLDEASGSRGDSHGSNSLADINTVSSASGKILDSAVFVAASSEQLADTSFSGLGASTGAITVSFWHKGTDFTGSPGFFGFAPASTGSRDDIYCRVGSGSIFPGTRWNSGGEQSLDPSAGTCASNNNGNWHHYVVRYFNESSRANIDAWYDGTQVTSATHATLEFNFPAWTKLYLGSHVNNFNGLFTPYLTGQLDEFAVWNRKITNAEIVQLYNSGNGLAYPLTVPNKGILSFF